MILWYWWLMKYDDTSKPRAIESNVLWWYQLQWLVLNPYDQNWKWWRWYDDDWYDDNIIITLLLYYTDIVLLFCNSLLKPYAFKWPWPVMKNSDALYRNLYIWEKYLIHYYWWPWNDDDDMMTKLPWLTEYSMTGDDIINTVMFFLVNPNQW